METCLLGEEQVGALNDILKVGLALGIDESRHVGDVDSLRSAFNFNRDILA
jgi:hypothetical protein